MFHTRAVGIFKTHFIFNNFFPKNCVMR